ncbi:MAG: DUF389 domain-containing protein [Caldilineaceae bacterium]|nr:DUF389 domain-containing protein [Caldilineaceae bacterium]
MAACAVASTGWRRGRSTFRDPNDEWAALPTELAQTILVDIIGPRSAVPLIRAGAALARPHSANLVVLSVVDAPHQSPENLRRFQASEQLAVVNEWIQRADLEPGLVVQPFVRTAANNEAGLLDTLQEMRVDLLLVAWEEARREQALDQIWQRVLDPEPTPAQTLEGETSPPEDSNRDDTRLPEAVERILRTAMCDVMILRGEIPATARKIAMVGPARGLASQLLAELGSTLAGGALAGGSDPELTYFYVPEAGEMAEIDGPSAQERTAPLQMKPLADHDLEKEILRAARRADMLLISNLQQEMLDRHTVAELPLRIASKNRHATLIVRPYDGLLRFRLRALWHGLTDLFPSLTTIERADVAASMRRAAFPTIDFFVLISLSAMIATFGLLQNSAAVIIGAMLVAPLMSPIVSTAMGVVEGDAHLIRVAIEATVKGIAVAIGIGVVMSLLAPTLPGSEILNRTQPNLLDLAVALASGAAGGYALARKEVSASLPGVSIAVALVPPLCVVGFGIANINVFTSGHGRREHLRSGDRRRCVAALPDQPRRDHHRRRDRLRADRRRASSQVR